MSEFQLYKKRDFSAFMSDTMQFFKQFWKNYFRNYVVINGALLLLMCVLYFIFFKDLFKDLSNPGAHAGSFFTNSSNLTIVGIVLFIIVSIALSVFSTAFPMIYLKLLKTKGEEPITSSELFNGIKDIAGRMILFGLISIFILLPLAFIVFGLGALLSIIIIGIPVLILAMPTFMVWSLQSLYIYLDEDASYFSSLGKGLKITFEKYWHVVGSALVLFMFVMIVNGIFSMVPAMMMMSSVITTGGHPEAVTMTPTMLSFYVLGMIFTFFAYNILYIHQGLIYYSSQENSAHFQALSEIENIGRDEA
ncbi:MAG: hypothetical protein PHT07_06010 [Paludibacter sp.]|nr:hypothetical protein [Paludibacter sp.]